MGKWLIGALLAATAWTPMAQAQEGGWRGRRAEGQQRPAQQQAPQQRGGWQGRGDGGGNRQQPQAQVGAQAQAGVQAQAQTNRGWQGRRDGQRWQQQQPDANPQGTRQQAFARDRNGDGRPDTFTRDRNGGGRPDSFARDRNGDARADSFARNRNGDGRADIYRGNRGYDAGRQVNRYDGRGYNEGRWNNSWRRDDRYDWNRYRSYNRNAFRLPRYYAPYGWNYGYRRFSIGVVLTSSLFGQNYWIDDPYDYRLPEAYGPYRWVRYYNDALLIDLRSGVVVDTVYDIFWY